MCVSVASTCRDNADKLMALTREVCALKLVESKLQASLAAASGNYDAAQGRIHHLEAQAHRQQSTAAQHCPPRSGGKSTADLQVTLAARDTELHELRTQMLDLRHSKDETAAKLTHCTEALERTKNELAKSKESTAGALAALREELAAEGTAEREALVNELEAAQARTDELQRRVGEEVTPTSVCIGCDN